MKRFGKSKGFRRTGRRTGFKTLFRNTASTRRTAYARPRELYLPVPAQLFASCKMAITSTENVAANGSWNTVQALLNPFGTYAAVDYWAEFFRPLMRIYSRASVAKVVVDVMFQTTQDTPLEAALLIASNGSIAALPGANEAMSQIAAFPESRTCFLAGAAGGGQSRLTCSVDVEKFLNQGVDVDTTVTSTVGGVIGGAPIAGGNTSPASVILVNNRTGVASQAIVRRIYTFHIRFSDRHTQSQTQQI